MPDRAPSPLGQQFLDLPEPLRLSLMLEDWMVTEGFVPLPNEWWHYDWAEWRRYPVMDVPLEDVSAG